MQPVKPTFHFSCAGDFLTRVQKITKTCCQWLQGRKTIFLGKRVYVGRHGLFCEVRVYSQSRTFLFPPLPSTSHSPFSKQRSERFPSSFSATSLTRSPVCLRAICHTSAAHPQRDAVPPPTVSAARSTVIKTSSLLLQQGETFKIQTTALSVYV